MVCFTLCCCPKSHAHLVIPCFAWGCLGHLVGNFCAALLDEMDSNRDDDEVQVCLAEDIRTAGLAAVELPLLVKPTQAGTQAALAMIGGIEELTRVTADEVGLLSLMSLLMLVLGNDCDGCTRILSAWLPLCTGGPQKYFVHKCCTKCNSEQYRTFPTPTLYMIV